MCLLAFTVKLFHKRTYDDKVGFNEPYNLAIAVYASGQPASAVNV